MRSREVPSGLRARRVRFQRLGVAVVALALSAVPGSLPASAAALAESGSAVPPLDTITLTAAISAAMSHYPTLAVAYAAVDRAAADIREATAARLPSISTDASFTRFAQPMATAPLHGFSPLQPPVFDRTLMQGGISLGYTLFDGGARGARLARAEALRGAGEAGVTGARMVLLGDVVRAYLLVLTTGEVLEANAQRLAALEGERDRAAQLLERGTAARVVLLRAEAALSAARAEWYAARGERDLSVGELARLTGLDPARLAPAALVPLHLAVGDQPPDITDQQRPDPRVPDSPDSGLRDSGLRDSGLRDSGLRDSGLRDPGSQPFDRQALFEQALASNPEIARLRRLVDGAEAARGEARSLWFPSVRAVGRYAEYGSALGREQGEWQGGLQFSFPLFTGGARQALGDRAAAEARAARAQLELARLSIASAIERAVAAVEAECARASALRAAAVQALEVARIERLSLAAGAGVQTDYLTAEAELLRVRAAWSAARAAAIGARVELARVVGELSIEWLARNLESGS